MNQIVQTGSQSPSPWLGKFVGVVPPAIFLESATPKQLLLMFDALALDLSAPTAGIASRGLNGAVRADIDYLSQEGLLSTLEGMASDQTRVKRPTVSIVGGDLLKPVLGKRVNALAQIGTTLRAGHGVRHTAADLRTKYGIDAVALPERFTPNVDARARRDDIVHIVLNQFPYPSDLTPWETIREYREDKESRAQWFRLKAWINQIAAGETNVIDFIDHLQERMYNYEETLKQHAMKHKQGTLEIVLSTTALFAENLVKIKWSEATKKLFDFKRQKAELLTAERDIPGRAVAYIINTRERFE
ncbi:hypothetical protein BH10PSE12_BH10PSE12_33200 [soil metagenome]